MAILDTVPEGADVLDIPAAHKARAEQRAADGKGSPYIKLTPGYVAVVAEIPLQAAVDLQGERIAEGLAQLLADPADAAALLSELTAADVEALAQFITGNTLGESPASSSL